MHSTSFPFILPFSKPHFWFSVYCIDLPVLLTWSPYISRFVLDSRRQSVFAELSFVCDLSPRTFRLTLCHLPSLFPSCF